MVVLLLLLFPSFARLHASINCLNARAIFKILLTARNRYCTPCLPARTASFGTNILVGTSTLFYECFSLLWHDRGALI